MKQLSIAKKTFLYLILVLSFVFAGSFATIGFNFANAYTEYYGKNTVSVTNGDFTSYNTNSNKLPYKPSSGWELLPSLQNEAYAGIIDTDSTAFSNNDSFTLPANPETAKNLTNADTKILMIKAKNNETGVKFGYESNDITLESNKFYEIDIRVKTGLLDKNGTLIEETDAIASIYTNLSSSTELSHINTSGTWQLYKIFVATDTFNSSTLKLQLRLGSKNATSTGVVFFDNVTIIEIANLDYFNEESLSYSNEQFINLNRTEVTGFTNSDFENDLNGFVVEEGTGNVSTPILSSISSTIGTTNGANNNVYGNTKSLFINNKTTTKTTVKSADDNVLTIKQHGYYYLTVLIKTGSANSDGLSITLDEKVSSGDAITASQTGLTSSSESNAYNSFKLVSFYIRGNVRKDCTVGISFSLGTSETGVSGWAIIDNIRVFQISENEYTSNSSDSTSLDLSKNIKEVSTVKNGSFDFITSLDATISYPMAPADWKYSSLDSLNGVIRVNSTAFANDCSNFGLTPSQNPGPNTSYPAYVENGYIPLASQTNENILMLRASATYNKYYSSNSVSLASNDSSDSAQITKFEIGIKTLNSAKAFIKIIDTNGKDLAVIDDITASDWTNYSIYIKNGLTSSDVCFVLGLNKGNENENYAFFDFAKSTASSDFLVPEILSEENSCYVDLITDSFYSYKSTKNHGANDLSNWSTYKVDSSVSSALYNGVVYAPNVSGLKVRKDALDKNVLVISNTISGYQIINSNYTFSISQGNYYEFSVYVKTDIDSDLNSGDFGAYFELANYNSETYSISIVDDNTNKFTNIISNSDDNNWEKYSIYIYAEEDQTISVLLGLGTEESSTLGKVYFDDVTVSRINEDEYKKQSVANNTLISKVLTSSENEEDSSESKTETTTESNPINIFILFSSIILAVALVFAIAGYIIRRIPKKNMAKVEKSEYSVKPTKVNENEVRRSLKTTRESKLSALSKEIEELKSQRENLQKEYEEKSNNEESLTVKENIYKTYTKKINKLTKQIDYMESAVAYNKDETNIKAMEHNEIKKKQKESIQEFIELKNKQENEVKKPIDETPKKSKKKKLNPNKIKKD